IVVWGVTAIVIGAIEREAVSWRIAHVGVVTLNGMPIFMDVDTASAVIAIGWMVWVVAATHHGLPTPVNSSSRKAVRCEERFRFLSTNTSAISGFAIT